MQQQNASFWADIKYLEERLAQNPESYLFARLADVYLKVNLVDDALHTAREGVKKYPAFIAGQRSLAMACHAKGLADERRLALEAITSAVPEDLDAQKVLAGLFVACGNRDAAINAYRVALEFFPEDTECLEELKILEQSAQVANAEADTTFDEESAPVHIQSVVESAVESDEIIDLTVDDIWVDETQAPPDAAPLIHDPLSTVTLAELYVKQGFIPMALKIYRTLRDADPLNVEILSRIAELESNETPPVITEDILVDDTPEPDFTMQVSSTFPPDLPAHGRADEVISTLEGWLDTIRRIKACR